MTALFLLTSCVDSIVRPDDENGDPTPPPIPGESALMYFWYFDGDIPNNTELERLDATFPAENEAFIEYISSLEGYPDTDRRGSMERRNEPTEINYRPQGNNNRPFAEGEMRAIQVRDPFAGPNGENTMIFHIPTTGFSEILFTMAVMDEGSADALIIDYSVSQGGGWTTEGLSDSVYPIETDSYSLISVDLSEIEDVNDNPSLRIRVRFQGSDMDEDNGNRVTFNNIAVDGISESDSEASSLAVTDLNDGEQVMVNAEFSITIQSVDDGGRPAAVENDTEVTLSLANGTGQLSGTLSGIISGDSNSVTISGILYDTEEEDVQITASAEGLTSVTTDAFSVDRLTYTVSLTVNPDGAGTVSGGGEYEEGDQVSLSATAMAGFDFVNWTSDGDVLSSDADYTFSMPAEDLDIVANFEGEVVLQLMHYFMFIDLPNNTPLESIDAFFTENPPSQITYQSALEGYPFDEDHPNWRKASMERRGGATPLNYRPEGNDGIAYEDAGNIRALQVKQPFTDNGRENIMQFEMSTVGYQDVVFSFAAMDEDAGVQNLIIDYSVSSGNPVWITTGLDASETTIPLTNNEYEIHTIDFSGIADVNNNPDFIIRVRFDAADGTLDDGDRVTFNNIALDGVAL